MAIFICAFFFFFNDTATTEIYTLSLHDALPISLYGVRVSRIGAFFAPLGTRITVCSLTPSRIGIITSRRDRKSTRLNSSHSQISYAVFCLKKKQSLAPCSDTIQRSHVRYVLRLR